MRYPSPLVGLGLTYLFGPVSGSLDTPKGFLGEIGTAPFYTKLRGLDNFRFRFDPFLRRTYSGAATVIVSAPYVRDRLAAIPIRRFEVITEVGIDNLPSTKARTPPESGRLRLLHVGRIVRTKGLRDAVRAMGQLRDLQGITLEVAGGGEDLEPCRKEAVKLGVADRITFHGRLPHDAVMKLYEDTDLFLFPSFREPTGIVLFEAMRLGIPVITTDRGGPGYIVDDDSGIRVPAETPEQLSRDLARAIRDIYMHPERLAEMSVRARARAAALGLWSTKIEHVVDLYREELSGRS